MVVDARGLRGLGSLVLLLIGSSALGACTSAVDSGSDASALSSVKAGRFEVTWDTAYVEDETGTRFARSPSATAVSCTLTMTIANNELDDGSAATTNDGTQYIVSYRLSGDTPCSGSGSTSQVSYWGNDSTSFGTSVDLDAGEQEALSAGHDVLAASAEGGAMIDGSAEFDIDVGNWNLNGTTSLDIAVAIPVFVAGEPTGQLVLEGGGSAYLF